MPTLNGIFAKKPPAGISPRAAGEKASESQPYERFYALALTTLEELVSSSSVHAK